MTGKSFNHTARKLKKKSPAVDLSSDTWYLDLLSDETRKRLYAMRLQNRGKRKP
jgi:predicted kinase